jgi:hypothetical protein
MSNPVYALGPEDRQSVVVRPPVNRVGIRIAEQEMSVRTPHRALGEEKALREPLGLEVWRDDRIECGIVADDPHIIGD